MAEVDGNEIVTTIRLELETLRKDLLEAQRHSEEHAHKMGEQIGHAIEHGFSHAFDHLKEKVIEVGLELAAAFTFEKSIEAASEFQTAVNQLNIALTTTGTYSAESSEHLVHLAESLQLVTTAGKAATIQGEALLGSLGHLKGEGLERATREIGRAHV